MGVVQTIRTCLFYFLLSSLTLVWCVPSLLLGLVLPYKWRYRVIAVVWGRAAIWLAKHVAGINYRVTGTENIPDKPCVILAKHQSTWETFFISSYFEPLSQVLKRELLRIPVFGWALAMVKPVAIDRSQPKQALKQVAQQGEQRLKQGNWLLIFPEGTRVPPGEIGKFSRSGAALAANLGYPVLPIAHNAGQFWPKLGWSKIPGTVDVVIGPLMHAEGSDPRSIADLNQRAYEWVLETQYAIGSLDESEWQAYQASKSEAHSS